jgi:hypothetical protein
MTRKEVIGPSMATRHILKREFEVYGKRVRTPGHDLERPSVQPAAQSGLPSKGAALRKTRPAKFLDLAA